MKSKTNTKRLRSDNTSLDVFKRSNVSLFPVCKFKIVSFLKIRSGHGSELHWPSRRPHTRSPRRLITYKLRYEQRRYAARNIINQLNRSPSISTVFFCPSRGIEHFDCWRIPDYPSTHEIKNTLFFIRVFFFYVYFSIQLFQTGFENGWISKKKIIENISSYRNIK